MGPLYIDAGTSGGGLSFATTTQGGGVTGIPTERMRIDNNGNVGIGTTVPAGTLDVQGGTSAAGIGAQDINLVAQSAGSGSGSGGGINLNAGSGANGWPSGMVSINNIASFQVGRHGNDEYAPVGGSPWSSYPQENTLFYNGWGFDDSTAFTTYSVRNAAYRGQYAYFGALSVTGASNYSPALVWGQSTSSTTYAERMRIDSNGNFGIGTTAPAYKLDVNGTINATAILVNGIAVGTGGTQWSSGSGGIISYSGGNVGIGTTSPIYKLDVAGDVNFTGNLYKNGVALGSGASGQWTTNGSDVGYANGNVGIGTTSPKFSNETEGSVLSISSTGINNPSALELKGNIDDANQAGGKIGFFNVYGNDSYENAKISELSGLANANYGQLAFFTANNGSLLERIRIDENGNVGIGTTGPVNKLDVVDGLLSVRNSVHMFTIGDAGGGPKIQLGTPSTSNQFFELGAYNNQNNFDNKDRDLQLFGNGISGILLKANTGNVGIGTTAPNYVLDVQAASSKINSKNGYLTNGADYAEYFFTKDADLQAGEVVCVDVTKENAVKRCVNNGDNNVLGIVSTNPSIVGNGKGLQRDNDPNYKIIGMLGQVPGKVSNENGDLKVGDSLTAAATSGVMRKANAGESTVGVALQNFSGTTGTIQILISRRNQSLTVEKIQQEVSDNIALLNIKDQVDNLVSQASANLNAQLAGITNNQDTITKNQNAIISQAIADTKLITDQLQAQIDELKLQNQKYVAFNDLIAAIGTKNLIFADSLGNLDLLNGTLTASGVETGVLTIKVVDKDSPTIGEGAIKAADSAVTIKTKAVSGDSKIFVTINSKLTAQTTLMVTETKVGESFTVELIEPAKENVKFNWWIVQEGK